jgi:DNA processing protein
VSKFSLESLLRLYSIPGIGAARMRNLLATFNSPDEVLEAPIQRLMQIQGIDKKIATNIKNGVNDEFINKQLTQIQKGNIDILSYWDSNYPESLKKIYDPPAFLFIRGAILPQDDLSIGIVGSRVPSLYGKNVTEQFAQELVQLKFTIISGLARGIDTMAHKSALKAGGRTIAVLGCGIDYIYPPENKKLFEQIADNGALISEYPLGTFPDAGNFPRRNRIISGLSLGVLIAEAGAKSGALITAFQALEQNREVFAIPGPINSGKSAGSNQLIKEGAKLVQGVQDIIRELENQVEIGVKKPQKLHPNLQGLEKKIYDFLEDEPQHVDALAMKSGKSVPEVLTVLLTLELMGVVKQLSGKMFIQV